MGFIVQRLNDYRLQLHREEIVRPMSFGANWQTLRIALLCTVSGSTGTLQAIGSTATGFQPLCMGVAQGTFGINNENTVDAIYGSPGTTGVSWLYTAGAQSYYGPNPSGVSVSQKFGGSVTSLGTSTQNGVILAADSLNYQASVFRMPVILDILKNSVSTTLTSYTFTLFAPAAGQIGDVSEDTWFDRIQVYGLVTSTTQAGSVTTAPVTGAAQHDNVFVFWSRFCPILEISAWAVVRFG